MGKISPDHPMFYRENSRRLDGQRPQSRHSGMHRGDGPIFMLQAHDKIGQTHKRIPL